MGEDRGAYVGHPPSPQRDVLRETGGNEGWKWRREASGWGWVLGVGPCPLTLYLLLTEAGALPVLHAGHRR